MKKHQPNRALYLASSIVLGLSVFIGVFSFVFNSSSSPLKEEQKELLATLNQNEGKYDSKRIVLTNTTSKEARELNSLIGGKLRLNHGCTFATITLPEGINIKDIVNDDKYLPYISRIKADYYVDLYVEEVEEEYDEYLIPPNYVSHEPYYNLQASYLNYLHLENTWDTTLGSYPQGDKVRVAIIDSGIDYNHPDFYDKNGNSIILEDSYNATEDRIVKIDPLGYEAINDEVGHGTAVAGLIAAQINEVGIQGIAPEVELLIIKAEVEEDGSFAHSSDLAFALYYAIEKDCDIVNMSFGGLDLKEILEAPVSLATTSDTLLVAAAGNDHSDKPVYPAAFPNVIGVGALEKEGWEVADYSNFGDNVDVVAPGTVYTTLMGGKYGEMTGTSFASPIVTAISALYLTQNKYATQAELEEDLYASCRDLDDIGYDAYVGYGVVDVNALLFEEKGYIAFDPAISKEVENDTAIMYQDYKYVRYVKNHTIQVVPEVEDDVLVFDGWYYEKSYRTRFDKEDYFTTPFLEDTTFYAKWINEDDYEGNLYYYDDLGDNEISLNYYKGHKKTLVIPSYINGKKVVEIGERMFMHNETLIDVTIPSTIRRISTGAFEYCKKLKSVVFLGNSLETIGSGAFKGCDILGVDIPDSVTSIGTEAFNENAHISRITLGYNSQLEEAGSACFGSCSMESFFIPMKLDFHASCVSGCYNITNITKHPANNLVTIENNVVYNSDKDTLIYVTPMSLGDLDIRVDSVEDSALTMSHLNNVTLRDVSSLGAAFVNSYIENIEFVNCSFSSIVSGTFYGTKRLATVNVPDSVTTIKTSSFMSSSVRFVNFTENSMLTTIEGESMGAFTGSRLERINLPESLLTIGNYTFQNCSFLKEITIPSSVYSIGKACFASSGLETVDLSSTQIDIIPQSAFQDCSKLKTVLLNGNRLETISVSAFENCISLETVDGLDKVSTLGKYAFARCSSLETLTGFNNAPLKVISDYSFALCSSLKEAIIPEHVIEIGDYAYYGSGVERFTLPSEVKRVGIASFSYCYELTDISVVENNPYFKAIDNILYSKDGKTLYLVPATYSGVLNVPDGVEIIEINACQGDIYMTGINFPESLTLINMNAFYDCRLLDDVTISQNVYSIGRQAFYNCYNLSNLSFSEDGSLFRIGLYAFSNISVKNLRIPSSVVELAQYAFSITSLESITFASNSQIESFPALVFNGDINLKNIVFENGAALTKISSEAFSGMESLETIDFGDAKITTIGNYAFAGCSSLTTLPNLDYVKDIGRCAFLNCDNLRLFQIGDQIEHIGYSAFYTQGALLYSKKTVTFKGSELPEYLDDHWDNGVAAVYYNVKEMIVDESQTTYDYVLTWDDTVILTSYYKNEKNVVLDKIDGKDIVGIGAFTFCFASKIETMTLNCPITTIGAYAFTKTSFTNGLIIPDTVKEIGMYAFGEASYFPTFSSNSQLEKIDASAFAYINAPDCDFVLPSKVKNISSGAFIGATLNSFSFGNNPVVSYIGQSAFRDFKAVGSNSITIPASVKEIDMEAFRNSSFNNVIFEDSTNDLMFRHFAFSEMKNLTEFNIPARVNYLGDGVFLYCNNLEAINVDEASESYASIDGVLFNYYKDRILLYPAAKPGEEVEIASYVKSIEQKAFKNNQIIKSLSFAEDSVLSTIGYESFAGCTNLETVTLPKNLLSIDNSGFKNCLALKSVYFQTGNETTYNIGVSAFENDTALEEINLPISVIEINDYAFYNCTSLTSIGTNENNDIRVIGSRAFWKSGIKRFTFDENLIEVSYDAFSMSDIEHIDIEENSNYYVVMDDLLFYKGATSPTDYENLALWPDYHSPFVIEDEDEYGNPITSIEYEYYVERKNYLHKISGFRLSEDILELNSRIFRVPDIVRYFYFNDVVEVIGNRFFSDCINIEEFNLPDSIKYIGEEAFNNCLGLKEITITPNVEFIGRNAFQDCIELRTVNYYGNDDIVVDGVLFEYDLYDYRDSSIDLYVGKDVRILPANFFGCSNFAPYLNKVIFEKGSILEEIGENFTRGGDTYYFARITEARIPSAALSLIKNTSSYLRYLELYDGEVLPGIGMSNSLLTCILPDTLKIIEKDALVGFQGESIIIPSGVIEIGENAFRNSNLTSIVIPDGVKVLRAASFLGCKKLVDIRFPANLEEIEDEALLLNYSNSELTNDIALPYTVTKVGKSAIAANRVIVANMNVEFYIETGDLMQFSSLYHCNYFYGLRDSTLEEYAQEFTDNGRFETRFREMDDVMHLKFYHPYNENETHDVTLPSTCKKHGEIRATCNYCDYFHVKEVLDYAPHKQSDIDHSSYLASTCQNSGHYEYWHCNYCDRYYLNEEMTNQISLDSLWWNKEHHTPNTPWTVTVSPTCSSTGIEINHCQWCDLELKHVLPIDPDAHNYHTEERNKVNNTCMEYGHYDIYEVCEYCHDEHFVETKYIKPYDHDFDKHSGFDATCTSSGMKEYWHCNSCDNYFELNSLGMPYLVKDFDINNFIIPAKGHNYQQIDQVNPTCLEAGHIDYECSRCGDTYSTNIDALGHKLNHYEHTEPSGCFRDGHVEYWQCARCYHAYLDAEATQAVNDMSELLIPASHTPNEHWDVARAATCQNEGIEVLYCSVCRREIDRRTVEKAAHTPSEIQMENYEEYCDHEGSYEAVTFCTVCYEELSRETVTLPPTGHHDLIETIGKEATCTSGGILHNYQCPHCGKFFSDIECQHSLDQVTTPPLGHKYGEWVTMYPASCNENGYEQRVCEHNSSHIETRTIYATGHNMIHYDYEEGNCLEPGHLDHYYCTKCGNYYYDYNGREIANYEDLIIIRDHNRTYIPSKAPTCLEDGHNDYFICEDCGKYFRETGPAIYEEITSPDILVIPSYGHNMKYIEAFISTNCRFESNIAYYQCSNCGGKFSDINGEHPLTNKDIYYYQHLLEHHDEHIGNCTEYSNLEYWRCTSCYNYYLDSEATIRVISDDVFYLLPHDARHVDKVEPTCNHHGHNEYWYCPDCGQYFTDEECTNAAGESYFDILPTYNHQYDILVEVYIDTPATEYEDGIYQALYRCSTCNESESVITTIRERLPHVHEINDRIEILIEPGCATEGLALVTPYCTKCGEAVGASEQVKLNPVGHDYGEWIIEGDVDEHGHATCYRFCNRCGEIEYLEREVSALELFIHRMNILYDNQSLENINEALRKYKALSDEEKLLVSGYYDDLYQYMLKYNERANANNNESREMIEQLLASIGASMISIITTVSLALGVSKKFF